MKISAITLSQKRSFDYNNASVELVIELQEGDKIEDAFLRGNGVIQRNLDSMQLEHELASARISLNESASRLAQNPESKWAADEYANNKKRFDKLCDSLKKSYEYSDELPF